MSFSFTTDEKKETYNLNDTLKVKWHVFIGIDVFFKEICLIDIFN